MTTMTSYAADKTGLLIVDPYNDFMSEGGKLYEATKETAQAVRFYDNMRKLIPAIRAARIHVIIMPHHRWREGDFGYHVTLIKDATAAFEQEGITRRTRSMDRASRTLF